MATAQGSSEPPLSVVVLPKPLSTKALALRRPELMFNRGVEYAEEGDLLWDVQKEETLDGQIWGPGPNVCYPTAVDTAFVGEVFRAGLIFRNSASYPLTKLTLSIVLITPNNHRTPIFEGLKANEISPFGHHDMKIMARLTQPGTYRLVMAAQVNDLTGEKRVLQLNFAIPVERAFEEVETSVTFVQRPPDAVSGDGVGKEGSNAPIVGSNQHALVLFGLKNVSREPLTLTEVKLVPKEGHTALYVPPSQSKALLSSVDSTSSFKYRYTGGGRDPLTDIHIRPGDTRNYVFELVPKPQSATATGPAGREQSVASSASLAQAMRETSSAELGSIMWEWRRANGDGGRDQTQPIAAPRPQPIVEVDLEAAVTPFRSAADDDSTVDGSSSPTPAASSSTKLITAYQKCQVQFRVFNRDPTKRRDLTLLVKPSLLLDSHWIYTGACSRLIGIAEPGGELLVKFSLLPMVSGPLALPSAAFQIRDANDVVLWPPEQVSTSGGARIGATVAQALCEVNVI